MFVIQFTYNYIFLLKMARPSEMKPYGARTNEHNEHLGVHVAVQFFV